jgi:hypothetical protein
VPAKFKMKKKGVGQMLRMPGMEAEMLRRAERIKGAAVGLSPVDEGSAHCRPLQGVMDDG